MMENGFPLTPLDIRTQKFHKALRGYAVDGVEEFRERVGSEVERLIRERAILEEQVKNFRDQLKSFREREKEMSEALVVAQQLRHDVEQSAGREAEALVRDAQVEGERLLLGARKAQESVLRDIELSKRQLASYLSAFRVLLERHLSEVDAVETHERASEEIQLEVTELANLNIPGRLSTSSTEGAA